jgi:hypothetical protein
MANIKSINGNPIVVDSGGIANGAVTTAKLGEGAVTDDKLSEDGIKGRLDSLSQDMTIAYRQSEGITKNPYQTMSRGVYNTTTGSFNNSTTTLISHVPSYFERDCIVSCESGYQIRALYFDGCEVSVGHFIRATTWGHNPFTIPAGSYALLQIGYVDFLQNIDLADKDKIVVSQKPIPVDGDSLRDDTVADRKLKSDGIKLDLSLSYEQFSGIENNPYQNFVNGLYNTSGGNIQPHNTTIITSVPAKFVRQAVITCDSGYIFRALYFDGVDISTGHFIRATTWGANPVIVSDDSFCLIQMAVTDFAENVSPDIRKHLHISTNAESSDSVSELNKDTIPSILALRRKASYNTASGTVDESDPQPLVLLHFSDIHNHSVNLKRIIAYMENNPSYIDDCLCTGDMTGNYFYGNTHQFWFDAGGTEKILVTMGNHDAYASVPLTMTDLVPMSDMYERWMQPNIDGWDVTYQQGKTYYYKDYATSNVRLIAIDTNTAYDQRYSSEQAAQVAWFEDVLSDARTANMHVVVACHFLVTEPNTVNTPFMTYGISPRAIGGFIPIAFINSVKSFIDAGGNFIGYLTGHGHEDYTITPDADARQFDIGVCNAHTLNNGGDLQRVVGTRTQDAFNIVGIDTTNHLLKIVRVGANMNVVLSERKVLTYNYATNTVIQ